MDGIPSDRTLPPTVGSVPLAAWAGPGRSGPHRAQSSRRWTLGLFAAVALVLILGLGYSGVAPWSRVLPGYSPATGGASGVSFDRAASTAAPLTSNVGAHPWELVAAIGFEPRVSFLLPGPGAYPPGGVAMPVPACNWTALSGSSLIGVSVPSASEPLGGGIATAWLLGYTDAAGDVLVATVLDGQASLYAEMSDPNCGAGQSYLMAIPSHAIDSPQAAAIAQAWGGAAFDANVTVALATYAITGGYNFTVPPPVYGNGSAGGSGNGTPLPQPPPPNGTMMPFHSPALWQVSYASCPMPSGYPPTGVAIVPGPGPSFFDAQINAENGTLLSESAYVGSGGCSSPTPLPAGPPPGQMSVPPASVTSAASRW